MVLDDYLDGFVSPDSARESYGVVIDLDSLNVDTDATLTERAAIRASRGDTKMFHRFKYFDTESEEYEWINRNIPRDAQ